MNKLDLDMRIATRREYLIALHAEVYVDGVRTTRAVSACESEDFVVEVVASAEGSRCHYETRYGQVEIRMPMDAPKDALEAYRLARGSAKCSYSLGTDLGLLR